MATVYDFDFFADETMSVYINENGRYGVWTPSNIPYFMELCSHSVSRAKIIHQLQAIVDYENIHIQDRPFIEDMDPVLQAVYINASLSRGESAYITLKSPFYTASDFNPEYFRNRLKQIVNEEYLHHEIEFLPDNTIYVSCRLRDRFSHKRDLLMKSRKKFQDAFRNKKKSRRQSQR